MIYVWNKKVNWPGAGSVEDNRYFDYVNKRYQGYPNIIWDVSKEALGYGHNDIDYITDRIFRIREQDAYKRLVTVHDFQYCQANPEMVDIISIQDWSTNLYDRMRAVRLNHEGKPVFNIEHGGYEKCQYDVFQGDYDDAVTCLQRNYICAFAGTYSTYYWQCSSWNVIIDDIFAVNVDPKPNLDYYKNMVSFFNTYAFHTFDPLDHAGSSGLGLYNNLDTYLYYIPSDNLAVHLQISGNLSDRFEITWFNPLTGEYREGKEKSWSAWISLVPEFRETFNIAVIRRK